jgi:hypothetical protein
VIFSGSALALFAAPGGDFFWSNPIFERSTWEGFTRFVRIALALLGAFLVLYELRARRMGVRLPSERTRRRVGLWLTVLAFGVFFDFGNPNTRYSEFYHRHEFYHYYLGAKYFEEVGYKRLYECTMVAEVDNGGLANVARPKRQIRDLYVNLIKPVSESYVLSDPDQCRKHFSSERWAAFKRDIDWFQHSSDRDYWEGMQTDHGFNPPPVWIITGKLFASVGAASDSVLKVLASIDVLLYAGCFLLLGWAFGWRVRTVAALFWAANAPADAYWTGGAFLRQDYWFLLVAAVCLARKRWFVASGFALTWSALLRIFPGLFVIGWAIVVGVYVIDAIRKRPRTLSSDSRAGLLRYLHPDHRRAIAGCLLALGTLVPVSLAVCGTDSYSAFYDHTLKTLQNTPLTNQMGLESMLVHTWEGRMRFGQDDNLSDPFEGWMKGRLERFRERKPIFLAIVFSVFAWQVWALHRTRFLWMALVLSVPMVMCLINVTCYYFSFFALGAVLVVARPQFGAPFLVASAISKTLQWPPAGFYWVDDRWVAESYLFFLLSLMFLACYSRPLSLRRIRGFWQGRPARVDPVAAPE